MLESYPNQPNFIDRGRLPKCRQRNSYHHHSSLDATSNSPKQSLPDVVIAAVEAEAERNGTTKTRPSGAMPAKKFSLDATNGGLAAHRHHAIPANGRQFSAGGGQQRPRGRSGPAVERSQSQISKDFSAAFPHTQGRTRHSYDANVGRSPASALAAHSIGCKQQQQARQLTLILMGAPRVGKSALVNQFLWEGFLHEYRPTVEEFNWVEYGSAEEPDTQLLLQIIDSSGSRDFLAMRHLYYRTGDAFMVVYAANDPQSYSEALQMLSEIGQSNTRSAPILLVANKTDVLSDSMSKQGTNLGFANGSGLSEALGEKEQLLLQSVYRMRISARDLDQVKGAFCWLIEELLRRAQLTALPLSEGRPLTDANGSANRALSRRRQSLPSQRTASELGIDQEQLRRLAQKHELHNRHACSIQ